MTILYALVARGKTVLAEFTAATGNFTTITRVILAKLPDESGKKMSYVYDQHVFHYVIENGLIFLCMCDDLNKRRVPFAFLEDIRDRFVNTFGQQAQTAIAFSLNDEFSPVLEQRVAHFQSSGADQFSQVNEKLDDVKNVMVQNIDLVLERGEKLELLVDKTENLQQSAFNFKKNSTALKNQMWWKKIKTYILMFSVLALAIFFITWMACGVDFSKCKSSDDAAAADNQSS